MSTILVVLAGLMLGSNSFGPVQEPPSGEGFSEASPERRIAMLDARAWINVLDPRVTRARTILDRVSELYFDDEERIVDLTEQYWREIRERGQRVSATEILEGAAAYGEAAPEGRRRRFSRALFLYARARENGLSHADSLEALREAAQIRMRGWGW